MGRPKVIHHDHRGTWVWRRPPGPWRPRGANRRKIRSKGRTSRGAWLKGRPGFSRWCFRWEWRPSWCECGEVRSFTLRLLKQTAYRVRGVKGWRVLSTHIPKSEIHTLDKLPKPPRRPVPLCECLPPSLAREQRRLRLDSLVGVLR